MTKTKRRPQGNPGKLPTWGRYTVPWITRWEGEGPPDSITLGYGFVDGQAGQLQLSACAIGEGPLTPFVRCRQGFAWEPCGKRIAGARPEFAQVHVDRQRRAMQELRCQVCSRALTLALAHWPLLREPDEDSVVYSEHPATRARCLTLATAQCPNMRSRPWFVAKAAAMECSGVTGCVFDTRTGAIIYDGACRNDTGWAGRMLAKQSIVQLHIVSREAVSL